MDWCLLLAVSCVVKEESTYSGRARMMPLKHNVVSVTPVQELRAVWHVFANHVCSGITASNGNSIVLTLRVHCIRTKCLIFWNSIPPKMHIWTWTMVHVSFSTNHPTTLLWNDSHASCHQNVNQKCQCQNPLSNSNVPGVVNTTP